MLLSLVEQLVEVTQSTPSCLKVWYGVHHSTGPWDALGCFEDSSVGSTFYKMLWDCLAFAFDEKPVGNASEILKDDP